MIQVLKNSLGQATGIIQVTVSEAEQMKTNCLFKTGYTYKIINIDSSNFYSGINGYFLAVDSCSLSDFGIANFKNADYQNVGTYTNPIITGSNLGIWTAVLVITTGDVVIYNNEHYLCLTNVNGGPPDSTPADFQLLDHSEENGYISVSDAIIYNLDVNQIIRRIDNFSNDVSCNIGANRVNLFAWGNNDIIGNLVNGNSKCEVRNFTGVFKNNIVSNNSTVQNLQTTGSIENCQFINSTTFEALIGNYTSCIFKTATCTGLEIDDMTECEIHDSTLNNLIFTGTLTRLHTYHTTIIDTAFDSVETAFCGYQKLQNTYIDNSIVCDFYSNDVNDLTILNCANLILNQNTLKQTTFDNSDDIQYKSCQISNCVLYSTGIDNTTSGFKNCTFENFTDNNFNPVLSSIITFATLTKEKFIYHLNFNFDGGGGSGAVGPVTTIPDLFVPVFYYYVNGIYNRTGTFISAGGGSLQIGIDTDAPTCILDVITGNEAAINATPINTNVTGSGNAMTTDKRKIVAEILTADITQGDLILTVQFNRIADF